MQRLESIVYRAFVLGCIDSSRTSAGISGLTLVFSSYIRGQTLLAKNQKNVHQIMCVQAEDGCLVLDFASEYKRKRYMHSKI